MSNAKSGAVRRLFAAILSIVMALSILPLTSVANAATKEHPNAATITVIDDATEEPIKNAKVSFAIYDNEAKAEVAGSDGVLTDENGVVEVLDYEPGDIKLSSVSVTHDDYNAYTNDAYNQPITGLDNNFIIKLTCKKIRDVQIMGKALTYNGSEQELVSVTKVDGDAVLYSLNGGAPTSECPKEAKAGTYNIRVTVQREGKDDLLRDVTTTIAAAGITDIDLTPKSGLKYNGTEQELVALSGSFKDGDIVTWTINGTNVVSRDVPKRMAVGEYTVKLTVDRGDNYVKLEKEVVVNIALGEINIDGLTIEPNNRTYDGSTQRLLKNVGGVGEYTLMYSVGDAETWSKDIPEKKDAGEYLVNVKAVKENYADKNTPYFPITVTIAKAPQTLAFSDDAPTQVTLGENNNQYNFAATGENLSGNEIVYSLVDGTAADVATIDVSGKVTVNKAGIITVKAFREGNNNYEDAVVYNTIVVKNASALLVAFDAEAVEYILDENGAVSEKTAEKKFDTDTGDIKYSIDQTSIGLAVDSATGKITVAEEWTLARAMEKANGAVSVTVTVSKAAGSLGGVKWVLSNGTWETQATTEEVFAADTDAYTVLIKFADAPSFDDACQIADPDSISGWYNAENPAKITLKDSETYSLALDEVRWNAFGDSATVKEQGEKTHYVYLKNNETKQVSAAIPVSVKVDTDKPDANKITVEYSKSLKDIILETITLGFYNPSVTATFTAYDVTSGIDYFTWDYTRSDDASKINHPEKSEEKQISADRDAKDSSKFTAVMTITADEANQYRGYLSVTATDKANNTSDVKSDSGNVFVVDTISPQMSIKYAAKAPYDGQVTAIDKVHYFNQNVAVELTITEANFASEDVEVTVTKDGNLYAANISWETKNAEDKNIGTFTLAGDGDYIVKVEAKDKSGNEMKESYTSETITVDTTRPTVKIDYVRSEDSKSQKTIFTVTEHNFRPSDITISGTRKDIKEENEIQVGENLTDILHKATWTQDKDNPDVYTYEYDQYENGVYELKADYTDIVNLAAEQFAAEQFVIDHDGPTGLKIEYSKSPLDTFLETITLGFYNPSVTVRFTAYDTSSGVASFTWDYTRSDDASKINHPEKSEEKQISADRDAKDSSKFTAVMTITADEANQYRGHIGVFATDTFGNKSDKKTDDGNTIVVDTIAPKISVEYTETDIEHEYFYNKAVDVKFTVTEANFYAEDVVVTVTRNGETFDYGSVVWKARNAEDESIGTFTLPAPADHSGDGHYVITVKYTDRSNNEMVEYVSDTHTIDTTKPVINVEYGTEEAVNTIDNREYFAGTQTATIKITEHNFNADDVNFMITAADATGTKFIEDEYDSRVQIGDWEEGTTSDEHVVTITYPGDANYTFGVAYTDKAANVADGYGPVYFTVDKTAPALENLKVNYSESVLDTVLESITFGFYQAKMTVTLTAEDATAGVHSFHYSYLNAEGVSGVNAELTKGEIQEEDIQYSPDGKTATATFEIPKAVLGNDNQFNGTVEFTATDRAGNVSEEHKETKRIVVDSIAPTAKVSYNEATNVVGDVSYYDGDITATVEINEANFYANDVQVTVSKDGGPATAVTPQWVDTSVDVHVGTFTLTGDGDYIITIDYADKSSNKMETYTSKQLTIDTQIETPTYTINGVAKNEVGGAYKGDAAIGFNYTDPNFDTKDITLTRTRFDKVEDVTAEFVRVSDGNEGGSGSFTIPAEVGNDGIYVLKISMTDRALHQTESQIKFTINRFGSVYEYGDRLIDLIKDGGQYVQSINEDIVITEYNAERLLAGSLNILITRDGENVDADFISNPQINSTVGIGESGWYQYTYTLKASNFKQDGVYKISLTSKYATDDSAENESTSVPENSMDKAGAGILDTMNFTVDSVAPEIRNIVNLDKKIADKDKIVDGKLNVKYTIVDVGGLSAIEIIVNDQAIQTLSKEEIAENRYSFTGSFDLDEQSGTAAQKVQIRVTDLAGNVTDTNSDDFLVAHSADNENSTYVFFNEVTVSRNFFVRWYANTGLFWGSVAGVVVLAGAIWYLIGSKKKKAEESK